MRDSIIYQMEPSYDVEEIKALIKYIKDGGWGGEYIQTEKLEKMISRFSHSKYCSLTVNGTISLIMALIAFGLKKDDEILVPDLTMIASPNSAVILDIKPVLVYVEPETLCMDLSQAEKLITPKTKALMYVAFNGRSGNMKEVVLFCRKHNLFLIEDAAQALGSTWQKRQLGTFGDVGSFSFSVPKIITTGQGGALITNNLRLYKKIEKIKDFGRIRGGIDIHNDWGWNFKFSDFLAVIGIEQMKKLRKRVKQKKEMYKYFMRNLRDIEQIEFIPTNLNETAPWFFDIYVNNRNKLLIYLKKKGVQTRVIYPAINTQKIYKEEYKKVKFPVAEKYAKKGLWLPSSIKLTRQQMDYIIKLIREFYKKDL